MTIDLTQFEAHLQSKLNSSTDSKDMLLLGKTLESTIGNITLSEIIAQGASYAPLASPTFTGTVSGITASMVGLGNVENKSSTTIRGEITSGNVTTALGFIPGDVTTSGTQTLSNKTVVGLKETKVAIAASAIDLSTGDYFTKTISGSTTFTVSNVPTTGTVASFILDLTNGGSAVTWWSGVKWASGTAPTLTSSGRDVLGFFTHDGGTTWNGFVLGKDVK